MPISSILGSEGYTLGGGRKLPVTQRKQTENDEIRKSKKITQEIIIGPVFSTVTTTTTRKFVLRFPTIISSTISTMFPTVENAITTNVTTINTETLIKQNSMLIEIILVFAGFLFFITLSKMQIKLLKNKLKNKKVGKNSIFRKIL